MKVYVKYEINRMIHNRWWIISIVFGCSIALSDLFCFTYYYGAKNYSVIQAWIGTDYQFAFNGMYYVMLPVMATLPHAGSYFNDIDKGYVKNICIRISRTQYYIGKSLVTFVSAAIVVMVPLLVNLISCMCLYPMHEVEKLEFLSAGIIDRNIMPLAFQKYQLLYCIFFIFIAGWFAGLISLIPIIIAEKMENFFNVIMVPFVLYIVQGVIFMGDETSNWSILEMVNPLQRCVTKWSQLLIVGIGGLFIMIWFIYKKGQCKDFI